MSASGPEPRPARRRGGLFRRIFLVFMVSTLAFVAAAAALVHTAAQRHDHQWVAGQLATVDARSEDIAAATEHKHKRALGELRTIADDLEVELDAEVRIYPLPELRPRDIPKDIPRLDRRDRHHLRRGIPVVRPRRRFAPPTIVWRTLHPRTDRPVALVVITPDGTPGWLLVIAAILLACLGLGARWVARSLTTRIVSLEETASAFADGDLSRRVAEAPRARDELDELAHTFNEMATRIGDLLAGQKALLANVSHELRTPIARMRVLLELLGERAEGASDARMQSGLEELVEDLLEMERLVADLLASGRLELAGSITRERASVTALCRSVADRFGAPVEGEDVEATVDALLFERLVTNVLANARRAAGNAGEVRVHVGHDDADAVVVEVIDDGPGIPAERREEIFEPFVRLDAARARDRGGVGLGLYLCRQIARAHGGDVTALDRADGRAGARLHIRIPSGLPGARAS